LGLHFLSGALTFDPQAYQVDSLLASKIVWLDAFITNVDRTFRNTNMLVWHKELWLIDHGASFYFHHSFSNWEKSALTPFTLIKDHVLLPKANNLDEVDREFVALLSDNDLKDITNQIPADWLTWEGSELSAEEIREVYYNFLKLRITNSTVFVNEAKKMRNGSL